MFFLITNIFLDLTFGILWWTTKNTTYCIYNGILFIKDYTKNNRQLDIDHISYDDTNFIIMTEEEYNFLKNMDI